MAQHLAAMIFSIFIVSGTTAQCDIDFTYSTNGYSVYINPSDSSSSIGYLDWWPSSGATPTSITNNPLDSNVTFTFSASGGHQVCVILYDSAWSCVDTFCDSIMIGGSGSLVLGSWNTNDTCGVCQAYAQVGASGGLPGYSYAWSSGGTGSTRNNLCAGTYTVTVTDANSSTASTSFIVSLVASGTIPHSFSKTNETCASCCDGTAQVTANTSTSINYLWSNGDTLASVSGLCPGLYSYTISNASCSNSNSLTIDSFSTSCYSITGFVSPAGIPGDVRMYLIQQSGGVLTAIDSTLSDSGGAYSFSSVCNGTYYVKGAARPQNSAYNSVVPTYYDSAALWSNASSVVVYNSNISNINFTLLSGTNSGGAGFIGGQISQGANREEGDPISGVYVIVYDESETMSAFAKTDENGNYSIPNLALGNYSVQVDLLNKVSIPYEVTLDSENPEAETVNFVTKGNTIVPAWPVGIEADRIFNFAVYPNPFNEIFNISELSEGIDRVTLQDIHGRFYPVSISALRGIYEVRVGEVPTGVYFLGIRTESRMAHIRVLKQ